MQSRENLRDTVRVVDPIGSRSSRSRAVRRVY